MIDRTLDRPRITTIDGEDYVVEVCDEDCCPFYWDDDGCIPTCLHPKGDMCAYWDDGTTEEWWARCINSIRGKICPLRVKDMTDKVTFTQEEKLAIIKMLNICKAVAADIAQHPEKIPEVTTQVGHFSEEDKHLLMIYGLMCFNQKVAFENEVKE